VKIMSINEKISEKERRKYEMKVSISCQPCNHGCHQRKLIEKIVCRRNEEKKKRKLIEKMK
jgi:hypothetical protein